MYGIGARDRRYHPIRFARGRFDWDVKSGGENTCRSEEAEADRTTVNTVSLSA
jgi:hypothetical protein